MLLGPLLTSEMVLPSLSDVVTLDVIVLAVCAACMLRFARLSITHPATIYLAFHASVVTLRALAVLGGAPTLFSSSGHGAGGVTNDEIARAMLLADAALIAMSVAWIVAVRRAQGVSHGLLKPDRPLNVKIIRFVAAVTIPVGCFAVLFWSKLPGIANHDLSLGDWVNSSWPLVLQMWAGLGFVALIYWYGFRIWLALPVGIYLLVMAYQGFHRFRVVIPLILLVQIYVERKGRRWPTPATALILTAVLLVFFPLKGIGRELQQGADLASLWQHIGENITQALRGENDDEVILDQFASTLTLADEQGKVYWGATYSGLATLPIPRAWWPEKPGLSDYLQEISNDARPMAENGMVATMLGEFYLNFRYPGVMVMSFLTAYFLGMWYYRAWRHGYYSLNRFVYIIVACNLIEVFRDGLTSLFVFTVIDMMPLAMIALLHFVTPPVHERLYVGNAAAAASRIRLRTRAESPRA
jgi:hypothetical protein